MQEQKEIRTNNMKELPLAIYEAIFFNARVFYKNALLVVKTSSQKKLKQIRVGDFLFIEQNPNTRSTYASWARQGRKIMWCIETSTSKYIGRVIDGVSEAL